MIKRQLILFLIAIMLSMCSFTASNIAPDTVFQFIQKSIANSGTQIERNGYSITGESFAFHRNIRSHRGGAKKSIKGSKRGVGKRDRQGMNKSSRNQRMDRNQRTHRIKKKDKNEKNDSN